MALLETNVGTGNQLLKPTDTSTLFRQRGTAAAKPVATPQPVVQQQQPQVAAPPTPIATPLAKAKAPVKLASAKGVTAPSAAMTTQATPLGEKYQYESPKGSTGVLDKNYYEDLGFSTSKEKAKDIRKVFKDIDTEATTRQAGITDFTGKVIESRKDLNDAIDNSWKDAATSKVTLAEFSFDVPHEMALDLFKSLDSKSMRGG